MLTDRRDFPIERLFYITYLCRTNVNMQLVSEDVQSCLLGYTTV
jgi:hypothetical protein